MPSALDTTVAPTPLSGTSTRDTSASCCAIGTDWASRRVHGVTSVGRLSINQQQISTHVSAPSFCVEGNALVLHVKQAVVSKMAKGQPNGYVSYFLEQYQKPHDHSFRRCEELAGIDQYSIQLKSKLNLRARLWDYGFLIKSLMPATQKLGLTSIEAQDVQQFLSYVKAKAVESYPLVELPPNGVDFDDAVDRSFVTTQRRFSEAEVVYMYIQREISLVGREGTLADRIKCIFDEQAQHQFLDSLKQVRITLRERYLEFRGLLARK